MTSGVLDKPIESELSDFSVACALHELTEGKPGCDRPATLIIRVHTCFCTVSCQQCWNELVKYMDEKRKQMTRDPIAKAMGGWRCAWCKRSAKRFEDLMWSEPL